MNYRNQEISKAEIQANPWKDRLAKRQKLIDAYIEQFENISTIWTEAVRDGYEIDLWRYVYAVAEIQAQIMTDEKDIGWNGMDIFDGVITDQEWWIFLNEQRRQAQTGHIEVAIPTGKITQWREKIEWKKKRLAETERPRIASKPMDERMLKEMQRQMEIKVA